METQELQKVVAIHTTKTSVHFLNEQGKPVFKLRVGDSYYVDDDNIIYVCKNKFARKCLARHFFKAEPVAIDKVDIREWIKLGAHKHLAFVSYDCKVFEDPYNWYSAFCSKLCFD